MGHIAAEIVDGRSNKKIAQGLDIIEGTVQGACAHA